MTETKTAGSPWIGGVQPPDEMRNRSMTSIYEVECREQPEKLAQMLRAYRDDPAIRAELDAFRQMAQSR